eukprot:CAMPEP_0114392654 /NCGR_PEP_ID=MMETSP0102-20121206/10957_1 /TAXON_ID=38822 ORGANISM="Pteridomonas danica, Strain PT" /NCGR_SAMPLE_ID=MMETSP0102 /ASSEMBLY_ACC=CAM_ASM_000212 /LENGTH=672 /DNA_ID=CAMNT_0001551935 /DNA_START=312 /DNA_END=2330 /DNA_ORIENTATION=+
MSSPQHQLRGMTPPSALRPNNRASSPQNLSETFPNKRGSVVTIALPSAKVLEEKNDDDVLTDDDDTPRTKKTSLNENNEANKDDMKDILENNYEENKANDKTDDDENENDKKTKEDDEEKNIINDRTIEDQIDDKSQLNIVDTNMIMKEKSILNSNEFAVPPGSPPGSREVPKRSHLITPPPSSFSDDNLKSSDQLTTNPPKSSESISPTNQINRSSQIRSHVVVPSVPFLPPQPSSMSFDIDLGPSRGTNPATQSPLNFADLDAVLPMSTRSLASSVDSRFEELTSEAQKRMVDDIVSYDSFEHTPLQPATVASSESRNPSTSSLREWQFGHSTLKGASFKPTSLSPKHGGAHASRRGYQRRDVGTDIWSPQQQLQHHSYKSGQSRSSSGGVSEVFEDTTKPLHLQNQFQGWKLTGDGKSSQIVTPSNTSKAPSTMERDSKFTNSSYSMLSASKSPSHGVVRPPPRGVDKIRNDEASRRAIRRMRAGRVGSHNPLKWQGLESHQRQLQCCDAAHITTMISKIDNIEKSHQNKSNSVTSQAGRRSLYTSQVAEPKKLNILNNEIKKDKDGDLNEPYLMHLLSKKKNKETYPSPPTRTSPTGKYLVSSELDLDLSSLYQSTNIQEEEGGSMLSHQILQSNDDLMLTQQPESPHVGGLTPSHDLFEGEQRSPTA